jgi:hypothetical protein
VIVSATTGSEAMISNDAIIVVFTFTSNRDHGSATAPYRRGHNSRPIHFR